MDAVLVSNFDLDSMTHTALHQNPSPALPHNPSRPSRHESDEISGLAHFLKAKLFFQVELFSFFVLATGTAVVFFLAELTFFLEDLSTGST